MAVSNANNYSANLRKRLGLVESMTGQAPAFNPPQPVFTAQAAPSTLPTNLPSTSATIPRPGLPSNYNFNDLAGYEEARRNNFANSVTDQLAKRRTDLATSLTNQGKSLFDLARPGILEDLNSRGVYNSSTAVSNAQAEALKNIELENQKYLNSFDDQATAAGLQAQQDALDAPLDIRRSELEARLQDSQASREEALARDLAKKQGRNSLYGSLIGLGGSLGGGLIASGGLSGLFGGGGGSAAAGQAAGTAAGAASGGGTAGAAGAGAGGIGLGGGLAIGGAGLGAMALSKAGEKKYGTIGGVLANPIGYQLNKAKALGQKVFGGGGPHTDTQGSDAWRQGLSQDEIAVQFGQNGKGVSYDANQGGSAETNWNNTINSFTPDQLIKRYAAGSGRTGTTLDKQYQTYYDQLVQRLGRPPTADEFIGGNV